MLSAVGGWGVGCGGGVTRPSQVPAGDPTPGWLGYVRAT
jgi:hypothetical protein